MKFVAFSLLFAMGTATASHAGTKSITFFSDGAIIDIDAAATRGIIEVPLASGSIDSSLRVKPLGHAAIQRVDLHTVRKESKAAKELDTLLERKNRLEDRLQALSTREDIFKAAVKSQSSKAPRKSKSNPDPMQSIRQGTDFAIAQLEAVNTARRRTMLEMRHVDAQITEARKSGTGSETFARISVAPANGRVRIRYAVADQSWTPRYDIRLNGNGKAEVTMLGQLPGPYAGYVARAAAAKLAESDVASTLPATAGSLARLAELILPSREELFGGGLTSPFSFTLTNENAAHLPAGAASVYCGGEYVGRIRFEGISSGRSRRLSSSE